MPVPTLISELSTTPGSNSPVGADAPSSLDDHQRTAYAFIRTLSDTKLDASSGVALTGNQTIAGTKTFSSNIVGNLTGNASGTAVNVTGTVAIANGGTGATTAAAAFTALKQAATDTATGVVELATTAETQTGTDTARAVTPAGFAASSFGYGQTLTAVTRTTGVTYTNTSGKPQTLIFHGAASGAVGALQINLNGIGTLTIATISAGAGYHVCMPIPIGNTYVISEINIATRSTLLLG